MAEPDPRRRPWLYVAAIFVAAFAIYWRSLTGPFLFDDADLLEVGGGLRLRDWRAILNSPRPLLIFTYTLNYWLTDANSLYFHLVSVLLHALNAVILWRLALRICGSPGLAAWLTPAARNLVSAAAPLLFLATPVQTESVGYISSRSELLASTFYLLALLVFLSGWRERRPWTTAGLVAICYGLSVTSKQHGLTLPGAIALLDYFFLAGRDWRQMKRNWPTYAVLAVEMAAGAVVVLRAVMGASSAGFSLAEVTWQKYLFTQFRMYFLYLLLLIAPVGLNADYDITPSAGLFEHGSWLALAGIVLLVGAAVWFRRRYVLASFGVLFFFLTLFPTSSFYPLLDYAAERRLYLPSIGFFLAALALASERWGGRRALAAAVGALLLLYAAGTYQRNRVWGDGLALWQDTAQKSPGKWRAHNNLGYEYQLRRMFVEATRAFQRASELVPQNTRNHAEILSSLGSTYANRKMYKEAAEIYQKALAITPTISNLWTNLAIAEIRLGRAEGWSRFAKAIELDPLAWQPHFGRGNLYYEQGRLEEAIKDYERVVQLNPEHTDAQYNLQVAKAMRKKQESGVRSQ